MIQVRPSSERGHFNHGWLDTYHTFSFARYHDPRYMNFRQLRVLNEDRVQPGSGFDTHEHWNMEILTVVLSGALEHRDSLGNGSVIRPGEIQRMTAGTGIEHSEFNHSAEEVVHFLQIWMLPERQNLQPSYEQRTFSTEERQGTLRLVASADGSADSLTVHQDLRVFTSLLAPEQEVTHTLSAGRHAWLQILRGQVTLNGHALTCGDGASASDESSLRIAATDAAEILLIDLG